jgi:hypothetical protein
MPGKLTKTELVNRVERLISGKWTDEEMEALFEEIAENVPCPSSSIQGYIFHSKDNANAETIVERMLAYKPIQL